MNKIYRKVWNRKLGAFVVASELATGHQRTGRSNSALTLAVASILLAGASSTAGAQSLCGDGSSPLGATCALGAFNPDDNDLQIGSVDVKGGESVQLTGSLSNVATGNNGVHTFTNLQTLIDEGKVTAGLNAVGALRIGTFAQDMKITINDPTTNSSRTVTVYDNSKIGTIAAVTGADQISLGQTGSAQYVDMQFGGVDVTGGTLNVDLENGGAIKALVAKQTALALAQGNGTAASSVNWNSENTFQFNADVAAAEIGGQGQLAVTRVVHFPADAKITAYDGQVFSMSSLDDLKAYNTWLISEVEAGRIDQARYTTEFHKSYTASTEYISYELAPGSASGDITEARGLVNVIRASGAGATGTLTSEASIAVVNNGGTLGGVMRADSGGKIVNEGMISLIRTSGGQYDGNAFVVTDAGSQGINNGVINIGLTLDNEGNIASTGNAYGVGALVSGDGAYMENGADGVINVGTTRTADGGLMEGIRVQSQASASNHGAINVGVGGTSGSVTGAVGVRVISGGKSFTNGADGTIYIGRAPQTDSRSASDEVGLTTSSGGMLAGISLETTGLAENEGRIVIGTQTQRATAMRAVNTGAVGTLINSGTIDILGAVQDAAPAENIGMLAANATGVANTGVINVGSVGEVVVNAIGLKAYDDKGRASTITSTGIMNMNGNASLDRRNYGAWAQGDNSKVVLAGGAVNLNGDGAIGLHSREGGSIGVDGGTVNFVQGEKQIGFFAYGTGTSGPSSIDIKSSPAAGMEVSTAGSTLFRVEDGAQINNEAGAKFIASGEGSTAFHATGVGTAANLNGMSIVVSGKDAVAVRVDGGASGSMSGMPDILLMEDGATAVVVDNNKRLLDGTEQAPAAGARSTFSNSADTFEITGAQNMTAFQVKNGAQLVNAGDIHVSHGTAIEIVGEGSSVVADASGQRGRIEVDDGVAGIHVHGGATLNTVDNITVDGSASGVLVGADAGRVVIEKNAHIAGLGSSYGNLVTNQAAEGTLLVDGATLEMQGSGAALLSEQNIDSASNGTVLVTSQTGGRGIALSAADGGVTDGDLVLGNAWDISVTGNGAGVYANTTGNVEIHSRQIVVSGPGTGVHSDSAGEMLIGSAAVLNATHADATLVSGVAGQVTNRGGLNAASAEATAVSLEGATAFANLGTGGVTGAVLMGEGNSSVLLADASTLNGVLDTRAGDDVVVVRGNEVGYLQLLGGARDMDTLVLDDHDYTAMAANAGQMQGFERVDIVNGTTFTLQRDFAVEGTAADTSTAGAGWMSIDPSSTLAALDGGYAVLGSVANAGQITLSSGVAGNQLTVAGNYAANGGAVELDTVLGDDSSVSDKLIIKGDSAGQGVLRVSNIGGAGGSTTADGIQLVQVDGASDGTFGLAGRVVAGTHEYALAQGGKADPSDGDWYLRSEVPVEPTAPAEPINPVAPELPMPAPQEPLPQAPTISMYRPEIGAYLGNQAAAASMFNHTLHERLGEVDFSERQNKEGRGGSVWMRVKRDQFYGSTGSNQIDADTDTSLVQAGAELMRWGEEANGRRAQIGVMAGMGHANSHVGSNVTGIQAKGQVKGKSVGAYGVWYESAAKPTGAYVDTWVQYGDFDHSVQGEGLQKERYNSRSMTGSVEAGYAFELNKGETHGLYLEPQIQAIYTDYRGGEHQEANGTNISFDKAGGLATRLGARLYTRALDKAHNRVQPFVETNWWHGGSANRVAFNDEMTQQDGASNMYEVKVGAQLEMGGGWTGWGEMGLRAGDDHDHAVSGLLGLKRAW